MRDVAEVRGLSWRRQRGRRKPCWSSRSKRDPELVKSTALLSLGASGKQARLPSQHMKVSLPWKSCLCGPVTWKSLPCPRNIWRCVTIYNSPLLFKNCLFWGVAFKKKIASVAGQMSWLWKYWWLHQHETHSCGQPGPSLPMWQLYRWWRPPQTHGQELGRHAGTCCSNGALVAPL